MPKSTNIIDELKSALLEAEKRESRYVIARRCGLHLSVIGRFLTGETNLSLVNAGRVAEAIGFRLSLVPMVAKVRLAK